MFSLCNNNNLEFHKYLNNRKQDKFLNQYNNLKFNKANLFNLEELVDNSMNLHLYNKNNSNSSNNYNNNSKTQAICNNNHNQEKVY